MLRHAFCANIQDLLSPLLQETAPHIRLCVELGASTVQMKLGYFMKDGPSLVSDTDLHALAALPAAVRFVHLTLPRTYWPQLVSAQDRMLCVCQKVNLVSVEDHPCRTDAEHHSFPPFPVTDATYVHAAGADQPGLAAHWCPDLVAYLTHLDCFAAT